MSSELVGTIFLALVLCSDAVLGRNFTSTGSKTISKRLMDARALVLLTRIRMFGDLHLYNVKIVQMYHKFCEIALFSVLNNADQQTKFRGCGGIYSGQIRFWCRAHLPLRIRIKESVRFQLSP